jgi:hypothetical protein
MRYVRSPQSALCLAANPATSLSTRRLARHLMAPRFLPANAPAHLTAAPLITMSEACADVSSKLPTL